MNRSEPLSSDAIRRKITLARKATYLLFAAIVVSVAAAMYYAFNLDDKIDDKIIAVPVKEPYYRDIKSIIDLPKSQMEELTQFYATYKIQEGGSTEIKRFKELNEAYAILSDRRKRMEYQRYDHRTFQQRFNHPAGLSL